MIIIYFLVLYFIVLPLILYAWYSFTNLFRKEALKEVPDETPYTIDNWLYGRQA